MSGKIFLKNSCSSPIDFEKNNINLYPFINKDKSNKNLVKSKNFLEDYQYPLICNVSIDPLIILNNKSKKDVLAYNAKNVVERTNSLLLPKDKRMIVGYLTQKKTFEEQFNYLYYYTYIILNQELLLDIIKDNLNNINKNVEISNKNFENYLIKYKKLCNAGFISIYKDNSILKKNVLSNNLKEVSNTVECIKKHFSEANNERIYDCIYNKQGFFETLKSSQYINNNYTSTKNINNLKNSDNAKNIKISNVETNINTNNIDDNNEAEKIYNRLHKELLANNSKFCTLYDNKNELTNKNNIYDNNKLEIKTGDKLELLNKDLNQKLEFNKKEYVEIKQKSKKNNKKYKKNKNNNSCFALIRTKEIDEIIKNNSNKNNNNSKELEAKYKGYFKEGLYLTAMIEKELEKEKKEEENKNLKYSIKDKIILQYKDSALLKENNHNICLSSKNSEENIINKNNSISKIILKENNDIESLNYFDNKILDDHFCDFNLPNKKSQDIQKLNHISLDKYNELIKTNFDKMVFTNKGSLSLQKNLNKFSQEVVSELYYKIIVDLKEYLKDQYANYFCQLFFMKLNKSQKKNFVNSIIKNFDSLLRSSYSFHAICSIFENLQENEAKEIITNYLIQQKNMFLSECKLLRILECFVGNEHDKILKFIFNFIIENLFKLIKIRQGFFLIRKVVIVVKDSNFQLKLVEKINENIVYFSSQHNGSLLCQCIIRNFNLKDAPKEGKYSIEGQKISKLGFIGTNLSQEKAKRDKALFISNKTDVSQKNNLDKSEECTNRALLIFYNILINDLIPYITDITSIKIIECALKYGGKIFHIKLFERILARNPGNDGINYLYCLIICKKGLKILNLIINNIDILKKWVLYDHIHNIKNIISPEHSENYNLLLNYIQQSLLKDNNFCNKANNNSFLFKKNESTASTLLNFDDKKISGEKINNNFNYSKYLEDNKDHDNYVQRNISKYCNFNNAYNNYNYNNNTNYFNNINNNHQFNNGKNKNYYITIDDKGSNNFNYNISCNNIKYNLNYNSEIIENNNNIINNYNNNSNQIYYNNCYNNINNDCINKRINKNIANINCNLKEILSNIDLAYNNNYGFNMENSKNVAIRADCDNYYNNIYNNQSFCNNKNLYFK